MTYVGVLPGQAKELLDHLESVLSNEPVEVVAGNAIVEVKPQGVSKVGRPACIMRVAMRALPLNA
jgi:trehalose-6-phosphatase